MNPLNYSAAQLAKAITGGVLAGLTSLGTALTDGVVTPAEWVAVAIAALGTGAAVFGVRNED